MSWKEETGFWDFCLSNEICGLCWIHFECPLIMYMYSLKKVQNGKKLIIGHFFDDTFKVLSVKESGFFT